MREHMTATVSPKPIARPKSSRNLWIIGGASGAVVLVLLIWLLVSVFSSNEPRLNENTVVLTKFVETPAFDKLEFEKKRQYYKVIDDRGAELDQAYHDHRLTEPEYRTA